MVLLIRIIRDTLNFYFYFESPDLHQEICEYSGLQIIPSHLRKRFGQCEKCP
jgi:hypothetical protein